MSRPCYELERSLEVPRPRDEVFGFFARPENLAELTPSGLGFRILTPSPIPMARGTLIDYVISLHGLPMRWRTLISRYDPPHLFVDEQLRGPYDFWHHTHAFEETDAGTLIRDRVRYAMPLGPLGRLAHALAVRRQLRDIFDYRARVIAARFPAREAS